MIAKAEHRNCAQCHKQYVRNRQNLKWFSTSKFCSKSCQWNYVKENRPHRAKLPRKKCINCGEFIDFKGNYYAPHRVRARKFCSWKCRSGKYHRNWNGGTYEVGKGYLKTNIGVGINQYLHRVVAEKALGRKLLRSETVHHINGDKMDNRNQNLLICSNSYHRELHERMSHLYAQEHFLVRS